MIAQKLETDTLEIKRKSKKEAEREIEGRGVKEKKIITIKKLKLTKEIYNIIKINKENIDINIKG